MTSLVLDPWVLALSGADDADGYVERLLDLYDVATRRLIDVRVTAAAAELLEEDGVYPISRPLPKLLWPRREDVYRVVANIIDKVAKLEDHPISETLSSSVVVAPAITAGERQKTYLHELLGLLAARNTYCDRSFEFVFTNAEPASATVEVTADIVMMQKIDAIKFPDDGRFVSSIALSRNIHDFFSGLSPIDIAISGFIEEAIALSAWQANLEMEGHPLQPDNWRVGQELSASLLRCGLPANRGRMASMLRTAVSILSGTGLRTTHALRVGSGAGERQLTRHDGAKAWRADIDDELHLHYWARAGEVEFANVVFHNCFDIVE